jgi:hypothetical protein
MADNGEGVPPAGAPDVDDFTVIDDRPADDEWPAADAVAGPGSESHARAMDAARVRQLSALRRGTYRARSYCFVAVGLSLVAVAQLALLTVRHVRSAGWQLQPAGYVCGALAAAMAAAFFVRRAADLTRELRHRPAALGEPLAAPDFSTLSDGSQTWKNLEQMREGS